MASRPRASNGVTKAEHLLGEAGKWKEVQEAHVCVTVGGGGYTEQVPAELGIRSLEGKPAASEGKGKPVFVALVGLRGLLP